MPLIARKINRAKWGEAEVDTLDELWSDPITSCLRTSNNTLSVWSIDDSSELNEAVLAIVTGFRHLDSIDVVLIDIDDIEREGINYEQTEGLTPVDELKQSHIDIIDLNYSRLGLFAKLVQKNIHEDNCFRLTKGDLRKVISQAIQDGRLKIEDLNKHVAKLFIEQ